MMTRRRFLIVGAAAAVSSSAPAAGASVAVWRGNALGAHAEIRLRHLSQSEAAPVFAAVEAELARLERIFSLYRSDSALSRLNRDGRLSEPPPELVELLALSRGVHAITEGLFDPTVQPVFDVLAGAAVRGRDAEHAAVETALGLVGMDYVKVDATEVLLERMGMALTLNGIAQGHVTDRITALLRSQGLTEVLVDIGEIATVGDWSVRIENFADRIALHNRSLATSHLYGTRLDAAGRVGHILHPERGFVLAPQLQVSVIADSAALADALSTAAIHMTDRQLKDLRARGAKVIALPASS